MAPQPRLQGIIPPLATPLAAQDQIDIGGTERLIQHVINGGVHGVFALGTTGEGTSLSQKTRHQFVEITCDAVQARIPVLVCITETSLGEALALAEHSYAAGAKAVVTAAPYYLPMTQADLQRYVEDLAERLPLPLLLYNMPSCTKTSFEIETVRELSQHPNIVGLKDTSGDLDYFKQAAAIARAHPDFTLLVGPEELLLETIRLGGFGGVTGGANVFPRLYTSLFEAATNGQAERAIQLNDIIQSVSKSLYQVSDSGAKVIQGIKTALAQLGICNGAVAEPFRSYNVVEQDAVAKALRALHPLIEEAVPEKVEYRST